MTDLITEARELCEKAYERDRDILYGRYATDAICKIPELCDALEKAEEQNKQLMYEVCKLACESVEREKVLAKLEAEVEGWAKSKQEGRLLALPCKVGDTVYVVGGTSLYLISEKTIDRIVFDKISERPFLVTTLGEYLNQKDFGKTIFLTREEAEAALKENNHE